jgi:O-acetylserine/cysteine efflux transporter
MKFRHVGVAVMIAAIWGVNFVVIDVGLGSLPPLLFAGLRFCAAAFPAIVFVRRPAVPWRWLVLIGLALGVGQFGLLFIAMHMGMPAGLSSLVLQTQAVFTALFGAALLRERLGTAQGAGMAVAFAGVALIGITLGQSSPVLAFVLCVAGASMWGLANIGMRKARPPDAFAFIVWVSLVPPLPLLALSLVFEGPEADLRALAHISAAAVGALLYIAYLATLVGFGLWGWLMRRYDAGRVAMYSLLVPPFGMSSAAVLLGERITVSDVLAAGLIIGGVALASVRALDELGESTA